MTLEPLPFEEPDDAYELGNPMSLGWRDLVHRWEQRFPNDAGFPMEDECQVCDRSFAWRGYDGICPRCYEDALFWGDIRALLSASQ